MNPQTKAELLESVRADDYHRKMQELRELNSELLEALTRLTVSAFGDRAAYYGALKAIAKAEKLK